MRSGMKWSLITLIGIIIILIFAISFFPLERSSASPERSSECNVLQYNGNEKERINILFLSPKKEAEAYMEFLFRYSPFKENGKRFNVFNIEEDNIKCPIYKNVAILCNTKEIKQKLSACPEIDVTVVLVNDKPNIRSSAYQNLMSINTNPSVSKFVLHHELGHGLFDLSEEYVTGSLTKPRGPNCATDCKKFEGREDGCYEGCTVDSYKRSVSNGVMRTLKPDKPSIFGSFNEYIITKILEKKTSTSGFSLTGQQIADFQTPECDKQEYILVELDSSGNIDRLGRFSGCSEGGKVEGPLTYELTSNGETVFEGKTNTAIFTTFQDPDSNTISPDSLTYTDHEQSAYILIPTIQEAEELNILDEDGNIIDSEENLERIGFEPCLA